MLQSRGSRGSQRVRHDLNNTSKSYSLFAYLIYLFSLLLNILVKQATQWVFSLFYRWRDNCLVIESTSSDIGRLSMWWRKFPWLWARGYFCHITPSCFLIYYLYPHSPICWRKWQPTPVLLPGKSCGWRSLVGYSPWGYKELDPTEWLNFHFHFLLSVEQE